MHKYQGFYIQKRSLRDYTINHSANILGYIAEVGDRDISQNSYYKSGDLKGNKELKNSMKRI